MKYNLIEIKRNPKFCEEPWDIRYDNSDQVDREACRKYSPHGLGFFYYPKKWGPEKAFDILKKDMIEKRQSIISSLEEDIDQIQKLKLPNWIK